jgi:hypothetical protein
MEGRFEIPFDDIPDIIHLLMVVLLALQPLTWRLTISQVVFQATLVFAGCYLFLRQVIVAGA